MRMREIRKAKHISQVRMSLDLNVSQNSISRYENGKHDPDLHMLIKIADYLNVSLDYLLERTDIDTWNPSPPS